MKSITKFIGFAVCLLVFMTSTLSLSACNKGGDIVNNPEYRTQNIYELYASGYHSFAGIDITSIRDTIYCDLHETNQRYVVLEGIVTQDYYCKLDQGKVVNIPICINATEGSYPDVNSVVELFQSERIFVYFCKANDNELRLYSENEKVEFSYLAAPVFLQFFEIILCTNGKTDLKKICDFLDSRSISYLPYERHGDYTNYIDDKMDVETLASNLTKLYEKTKNYKGENL